MKKKIHWPDAKITSKKKAGTYGSYKEFIQKANKIREEQQEAIEYLNKAMAPMTKMLEYKILNKQPITVMRPLSYQTSGIAKAEEDDGFYHNPNPQASSKFVDKIETIYPGTTLMFKSLDPNLREFIFVDGVGTEHAISYDEKQKILTQTSIYEETKKILESKQGDK